MSLFVVTVGRVSWTITKASGCAGYNYGYSMQLADGPDLSKAWDGSIVIYTRSAGSSGGHHFLELKVLSDEDASPEERIESIAHWIEAYQGFMRWLAPRAGITIAYDAHAGRYIDYAKYLRAHGWSDERAEEYAVKRDAELFGA